GELKLAEAAFAKAVSLYAPANSQFLIDLSRVREKLGDFQGSLEAMERYSKIVQQQGQETSWSDKRIAELRSKATKQDEHKEGHKRHKKHIKHKKHEQGWRLLIHLF